MKYSRQKKVTLCYLMSFSNLNMLNVDLFKLTLIELAKVFGEIYIVNIDNLIFNFTTKKNTEFKKEKKLILVNPKSYLDINFFFSNITNPVIISQFPRTFSCFGLLFYLRFKKIPIIEVSNVGNINTGAEFFMGKANFSFLKLYLFKILPRKLSTFFSIVGVFPKMDCKFVSQRKIYLSFNKKTKFYYYKDMRHIKSSIFENTLKVKKTEDYITLLDQYPLYDQMKVYKTIAIKDIKLHYQKINTLLLKLKYFYKKKVAICIHPKYPENFYKKFLPDFKIYKNKTDKFINKSFIVMGTNSSAITQAINLDKKIILLNSDIFKNKHYSTYVIKSAINAKCIKLSDKYNFNKKSLIRTLENKVRGYNKYKKDYMGINLMKKPSEELSDYIIKHYM